MVHVHLMNQTGCSKLKDNKTIPAVGGQTGRKRGKMYIFEAHFINMDNYEEIVRRIEFDGQFLANEKECYLYAMGRAYDMTEKMNYFLLLNLSLVDE